MGYVGMCDLTWLILYFWLLHILWILEVIGYYNVAKS